MFIWLRGDCCNVFHALLLVINTACLGLKWSSSDVTVLLSASSFRGKQQLKLIKSLKLKIGLKVFKFDVLN
jgi:hypothetical protein